MAQAPDRVTAPPPGEGGSSKFAPHSEGTHMFVCVDIIDMGQKLDTFPGKAPKLTHRVAMVFASGERHEDEARSLVTVQQEFALSTYETSSLRKFVQSWYGKTFTDEQLKDGFALHKLVARPILLTVEHKTSAKGRKYAVIKSPSPLPKGMPVTDFAPVLDEYVRADYWAKTKDEYAKEAATFAAQQKLKDAMPVPSGNFEDFPGAMEDETDDLPF